MCLFVVILKMTFYRGEIRIQCMYIMCLRVVADIYHKIELSDVRSDKCQTWALFNFVKSITVNRHLADY